MIDKERLEELIEQSATIYTPDDLWQTIGTIKLNKKCYFDFENFEDGRLCNSDITFEDLPNAGATYAIPLNELYETKEQAEWKLKMTRTRTEELCMPMWEEFRKLGEFTFYGFHQGKIKMFYDISDDQIKIDIGKDWYIFYKEYNKENYIEACELCLKLFSGEEI